MKFFLLTIITAIGIISSTIAQIPTNGLIAYYPFNNNANDLSGNGNNGVVNGATLTTDRFGNANSAYLFNGTSDYISVANSTSLQSPTNQFTLSAWVNATDLSVLHWILDKRINALSSPFSSYSLFTAASKWRTSASTSEGESSGTGNTSIVAGTWINLIGVYDGSKLSLYINGVLESSINLTGNIQYSTLPLFIGKSPNENAFMKGKIDDIRIYNRALSSNEITQVYNEVITSISDTELNNIIKLYPNPNNGTFVVDASQISLSGNISILNSIGTKVYEEKFDNYKAIDISYLPSGVYLLKLRSGEKEATKKIIIK